MGLYCQLLSASCGDQTGQTGETMGSGSGDDCLLSSPAVISEILFHATTQIGYCNELGGAGTVCSSHRADSLFLSELKEHTLPVTT